MNPLSNLFADPSACRETARFYGSIADKLEEIVTIFAEAKSFTAASRFQEVAKSYRTIHEDLGERADLAEMKAERASKESATVDQP